MLKLRCRQMYVCIIMYESSLSGLQAESHFPVVLNFPALHVYFLDTTKLRRRDLKRVSVNVRVAL